ncbi:MAG: tail fiber domain-containing protein, partial [Thermoanaerobaculia bacterium]|nr:tail fiber domain-containing protein [Thermoanaerobaculia bacterium]
GTQVFTVEDVTAGTSPLRILAGTQNDAIQISDRSIDVGNDLNVPDGEVTTDGVRFSSSRTEKEDLEPVDPQEVLKRLNRVPVAEWSFKDDENGTRHIGPTAEDFQEAFPLPGKSEKHLSAMDVQGVALAAIQGLSQRLEGVEEENAALRARLAELESRLDESRPEASEEPTER